MTSLPQCSGCGRFNCIPCRIRRNIHSWKSKAWAKLPDGKPWLRIAIERKTKKRILGLVCVCCRHAHKCHGTVPDKVAPFVKGTANTSSVVRQFALKRHSKGHFHNLAAKQYTACNMNGKHPVAPSTEEFGKVVDHVLRDGASVHSGVPDIKK